MISKTTTMKFSIPILPCGFVFLYYPFNLLVVLSHQLPGGLVMKCNKELCRKILGRNPQPDYCDLCQGSLMVNEYHAEEY